MERARVFAMLNCVCVFFGCVVCLCLFPMFKCFFLCARIFAMLNAPALYSSSLKGICSLHIPLLFLTVHVCNSLQIGVPYLCRARLRIGSFASTHSQGSMRRQRIKI
mmetsp:Transcript_72134/g.192797  ORF Transcript_72134/g.192797 Transcript_72134/m.192797 type:complete len:107 (+) Transcript_72134:397-717(+)